MRWFKHYTDSLDDPFIHDLMDEFGAVGYLAYFGIIEIICKENGRDLTGKLSISPTYLRRKLRTSQGKLRQVFDFCQTFGKLSVNFSEKIWEFEFTKIADIKDNYTKDLQATGKKPSKHKEEEKEVYKEETEEERDKRKIYGEYKHVRLTQEQYDKLITDFGGEKTKALIKRLDEGIEMKGYKYKNFNLVIRNWEKNDGQGGNGQGKGSAKEPDYDTEAF